MYTWWRINAATVLRSISLTIKQFVAVSCTASDYLWRSIVCRNESAHAKRIKELEVENARLKKLEREITREALR